jgi:hypothetical protein
MRRCGADHPMKLAADTIKHENERALNVFILD